MGRRQAAPRPPRLTATGRLWVGLTAAGLLAGLAATALVWSRHREASAGMTATPIKIDGPRALKYLKQVCEIGPRPAGSAANDRQRALVSKHFQAHGAKVLEQPFDGEDPVSHAPVKMANLVGSWFPDRRSRVVIGAHYDTRPFPDEDRDPAKRKTPFIGANDGGSGVALLMEIAHHLDTLTTTWGVDLVLFDGEELIYGAGDNFAGEFFLGSKEFGRLYAVGVEGKTLTYRYDAGIVLDMVGDKDLQIDQEGHSLNLAPDLVREVWAVAKRLNVKAFRGRTGKAVNDDHLPLNNAGIPAIDLIDFDYPYWHTSQDLPDKCSAYSLEQVGRVVVGWLATPRKRTR